MNKFSNRAKREKLKTQRKIGFLLVGTCVLSVILCNVFPILKGADLSGLVIVLPIGLAMIFSKDVIIY